MLGFSSDILFDFDVEISRYADPDKVLNWKEKVVRNFKTFLEILYHIGFYFTHTVYFLQTCYFYYISGRSSIVQNIRFGRKPSNFLDVYSSQKTKKPLIGQPVFLFIYGGAWGRFKRQKIFLMNDQWRKVTLCKDGRSH